MPAEACPACGEAMWGGGPVCLRCRQKNPGDGWGYDNARACDFFHRRKVRRDASELGAGPALQPLLSAAAWTPGPQASVDAAGGWA